MINEEALRNKKRERALTNQKQTISDTHKKERSDNISLETKKSKFKCYEIGFLAHNEERRWSI